MMFETKEFTTAGSALIFAIYLSQKKKKKERKKKGKKERKRKRERKQERKKEMV